MTEWVVRLEYEGVEGGEAASDRVDTLLDLLEGTEPVVSHGPDSVAVLISVQGPSSERAFATARGKVGTAMDKAGFGTGTLTSVEIKTMEALEREIATPNFPDLVGIAEAAEILGVSKQRTSELSKSRRFPPPIIRLASGPIWLEGAIHSFADDWERKPGRPRKAAAG